MNTEAFGVVQEPATKVGSRWKTSVTTVDEGGKAIGAVPIRPCRTRRELMARADILAAKLSAAPGYRPDVVI